MKTFTININSAPPITAINRVYTISDQSQITYLYPISNEVGVEPTIISSVSDDTLINGNLEIDSISKIRILFTPNTILDSVNFDYTIKDSLDRESTATITIITI